MAIRKRQARTGSGTPDERPVWGWIGEAISQLREAFGNGSQPWQGP